MLEIKPRGPINEEQLVEVEHKLGVRLPEPYRSWLQRTGGGPPAIHNYTLDEVDGSVNTFLGIDNDNVDLTDQYYGFDEVLPRDLIRIAYGNGGTIAIKVRGDDIGSIWWSDHDESDGYEEPSYDYVTRLNDDFEAFLNRW